MKETESKYTKETDIEDNSSDPEEKEAERKKTVHILNRISGVICSLALLFCTVTCIIYIYDRTGIDANVSLTDYLYHSEYGEDGEGVMNLYFDMNAYVRDTNNRDVAITYWASDTNNLSNGDVVDVYVYQDKGTNRERQGHITCCIGGLTTESESNILSSAMSPSESND